MLSPAVNGKTVVQAAEHQRWIPHQACPHTKGMWDDSCVITTTLYIDCLQTSSKFDPYF